MYCPHRFQRHGQPALKDGGCRESVLTLDPHVVTVTGSLYRVGLCSCTYGLIPLSALAVETILNIMEIDPSDGPAENDDLFEPFGIPPIPG